MARRNPKRGARRVAERQDAAGRVVDLTAPTAPGSEGPGDRKRLPLRDPSSDAADIRVEFAVGVDDVPRQALVASPTESGHATPVSPRHTKPARATVPALVVPCALCRQGSSSSPTGLHHLTHGVSVWLCDAHRSERSQRRDGGTHFASRLEAIWLATGTLTARRAAALRTHVRQIAHAGAEREQPGSYAWPQLRREAEQRFAAGDDPREVISDLRARHRDCPAMAPSARTMRRWFTQGRWRSPCPKRRRATVTHEERLPIPAQYMLIPYTMSKYLYWGFLKPPRRHGP